MPCAAGEQTGRIRGVVTDDTGQALAGVTIIATSPALIGDPRVVMATRGSLRDRPICRPAATTWSSPTPACGR